MNKPEFHAALWFASLAIMFGCSYVGTAIGMCTSALATVGATILVKDHV